MRTTTRRNLTAFPTRPNPNDGANGANEQREGSVVLRALLVRVVNGDDGVLRVVGVDGKAFARVFQFDARGEQLEEVSIE